MDWPPNFSDEFLTEFIEMLRQYPSLWDNDNPDVYNIGVRVMAFHRLMMKYREIFPQASILTVRDTIEGLQSSYKDELTMINEAKRRGEDPVPWRFFHLLEFLDGKVPVQPRKNMYTAVDENDDGRVSPELSEEQDSQEGFKPTVLSMPNGEPSPVHVNTLKRRKSSTGTIYGVTESGPISVFLTSMKMRMVEFSNKSSSRTYVGQLQIISTKDDKASEGFNRDLKKFPISKKSNRGYI